MLNKFLPNMEVGVIDPTKPTFGRVGTVYRAMAGSRKIPDNWCWVRFQSLTGEGTFGGEYPPEALVSIGVLGSQAFKQMILLMGKPSEIWDDEKRFVPMRYVGDQKHEFEMLCEYLFESKTYSVHYRTIVEMTYILHTLPAPVRESILFWCKMIHNPD